MGLIGTEIDRHPEVIRRMSFIRNLYRGSTLGEAAIAASRPARGWRNGETSAELADSDPLNRATGPANVHVGLSRLEALDDARSGSLGVFQSR